MSMHVVVGSGPLASATALRLRRRRPGPRGLGIPSWPIRASGLLVPNLRALGEVACQLARPFVVNSTACQDLSGATPTPMDQALPATLTRWHDQGRATARKE